MSTVAASATVAGCTTRGSLTIEIRDYATQQPVADATVRVDGLGFFVPIWPHWQLSRGIALRSNTDAHGIATFPTASFPAVVYIISSEHLPMRLELRDPPDESDADVWMTDANRVEDIQIGRLVEARVRP